MKRRTKLVKKETVADGTMAFYFERPAGFDWKAGQSLDLFLVDPPETDDEGNSRAFSIAAAPHEEHLMIATRMRDTAFKRVLKNAQAGMPVDIDGPFGSFYLHSKCEHPAIFLVGGIGVTPFYSMVKDVVHKASDHRIYFFYSNRRPQDAAFLTELQILTRAHANITFVPTMTEPDVTGWDGERGYITRDMLDKYAKERPEAIYYAAGPLVMVQAMRKLLTDVGVSDDDIRSEEFAGY